MNDNSEILKFYNLRDNPFKLEVIPSIIVGYTLERERLLHSINNKEKIVIIIGPTGAGKTTILSWIFNYIKNKNKYIFYRPFKNKEEFFKDIEYKLSFFDRLLMKIKRKTLIEFLKDKNFLILIDEAHFLDNEVIEWIKILSDQTNFIFILAGLPEFEEKLIKEHRTLYERITTRIYLKSLDLNSTKELIRKRLEIFGNSNLFTDDAIEYIYRISGGFPREILKISYEALLQGYSMKKNIIDSEVIEKIYESKRPPQEVLKLTAKQKYIAEILVKYGPKTVSDLLKIFNERYKDTSIYALSNILKRMVKYGYLIRNKINGKFIYDVSPNIKEYLIKENL